MGITKHAPNGVRSASLGCSLDLGWPMLGSVVNKIAGNMPPDPGCLLQHAGLLLDFCSLNSWVWLNCDCPI